MAWSTQIEAAQLALTGSYQIVQAAGGGDLEITLNPGELAQVMLDYNPTDSTPTENCDVEIQLTSDGIKYETSGQALRSIIEYDITDPAIRNLQIVGTYGFRIAARLRNPADDGGGADSGSTLNASVRQDGVSI